MKKTPLFFYSIESLSIVLPLMTTLGNFRLDQQGDFKRFISI